jgi:hypothetical protein
LPEFVTKVIDLVILNFLPAGRLGFRITTHCISDPDPDESERDDLIHEYFDF